MNFFIAYQYEEAVPGGVRVGFGNCVQRFDFHPLNDPARAGAEIAVAVGVESVTILNVQVSPGDVW